LGVCVCVCWSVVLLFLHADCGRIAEVVVVSSFFPPLNDKWLCRNEPLYESISASSSLAGTVVHMFVRRAALGN